ncbi:6-phospho-beta-glucosidase [Symbiobacterium thermophilum]|uniref:6-phospho-beta-glucosidase n=1 Tax=Symbiobacterium thermophilum TaxID=2734 RepID=A0A953I4R7_SYMTR|nr:6-phospho-beta-glucosidase [Symbiobacterium thermophilum]MBY6276852.1 6-phospho-beta-glucosidase [Symbiobacterium thermophilum]
MKLTIIGGASAYTPDIILGLLQDHALYAGGELCLHDIDGANLRVIERLARALVRAAGADLRVTATLDRAEAITGSRFILTQPRVGGLQHRALDEKIPLKHGLIGQETLGLGGFAFAWRTIPVMLEIVEEVQRLAPEAWIINYANPAGMVTEAVIRRFPDARFIGLCDMPTGLQWAIGRLLRVDYRRIALDYAGINHGGWVSRVLLDGEDVTARLRRWAAALGPVASLLPLGEQTGTVRLFRQHGMVPDPYLRYYYYKDQILKKLLRAERTRAEFLIERVQQLYRHYADVAGQEQPVLKEHRGHPAHSDLASQVIAAMAANRPTRFVIQQRGAGAVRHLPPEEAAQFPAIVDGSGWTPIPQPALPRKEAELIARIKTSETLNVRAAMEGDRSLAVEAAELNPLGAPRPLAEKVVDELLAAHRKYLPQFA